MFRRSSLLGIFAAGVDQVFVLQRWPSNGNQSRIGVGNAPAGIAVAYGFVWVASQAP